MDLQTMLDNATEHMRAEVMKTSRQLTLGELIIKLEAIPIKVGDDEQEVRFDFGSFYPNGLMSWRGSYRELAIDYSDKWDDNNKPPKLSQFIKELKEAIGKTYEGYKGGDFIMGKTTPIWVAHYGDSGETAVVDILDEDYKIILRTEYCKY